MCPQYAFNTSKEYAVILKFIFVVYISVDLRLFLDFFICVENYNYIIRPHNCVQYC